MFKQFHIIVFIVLSISACSDNKMPTKSVSAKIAPLAILPHGVINENVYRYYFADLLQINTAIFEPKGQPIEAGGILANDNGAWYFYGDKISASAGNVNKAIEVKSFHSSIFLGEKALPAIFVNRIVVVVGYYHNYGGRRTIEIYSIRAYPLSLKVADPKLLYHDPVIR